MTCTCRGGGGGGAASFVILTSAMFHGRCLRRVNVVAIAKKNLGGLRRGIFFLPVI